MGLSLNQPHAWILAALLAAGVAIVFPFYRRVPSTVGRGLRLLLITLRCVAIAFLLLALMEPVVAITRTVAERPVVAVLLDVSRSMAVDDGTGGVPRGEEAVVLLNEVVLPRIVRDAEVSAYAFAERVEPIEVARGVVLDPPESTGDATDLGGALAAVRDELREANLRAVVIATDGAINRGESAYDAAVSLDVPVFALGVGSGEPRRDVAVREVVTNRISYTGEKIPVEARVAADGFEGAEVAVELREGDELLDSARVVLPGGGGEVAIRFEVAPTTPGVHRYVVSVPPVPGELSGANNARMAATNTSKGKIRALVLASRPGWDFAFLRREMEEDRNIGIRAEAVKSGAPAEGERAIPRTREELLEYDLVALVDPEPDRPLVADAWLTAFVRERGGGLLVLGLPGRLGDALREEFAALLPVERGSGGAERPVEARVTLAEAGESAPVMRIASDRFENAARWSELPPVWTGAAAWRTKATAEELLTAAAAGRPPVVAAWRVGAGAVMSVAAEGVWRWKLAAAGEDDPYDRFVSNAARWLTARGDLARVAVDVDKDVYAAGEIVRVSGQVYRDDYTPDRSAELAVSISRGEAAPVWTMILEPGGDFYRGEAPPLPPGRYAVEATASIGGERVGVASREFTVEAFSLEDSEVRRRTAVLRRIADDTGGACFFPETIEDVPDAIALERSVRSVRKEFELWDSPWLLIGFVGALSLEWTLRRRKGLP